MHSPARLVLLLASLGLTACNWSPSGNNVAASCAPIPATGHKAQLTIHFSDTGYFMGQKQGEPHDYPVGPGTVYWTANQARTEENMTGGATPSAEIARSYISDTGAGCYWRFQPPRASDNTAFEYWLRGGTPLPGALNSAWVAEMPFCALGLSKDYILQQLRASRELVLTDLGAQTVSGEACHGVGFQYSGRNIPGSTRSELWFSDTWQVPWRVVCTRPGGSEQWIVDVSGVEGWTPDPALLRLPRQYWVNRFLKQ